MNRSKPENRYLIIIIIIASISSLVGGLLSGWFIQHGKSSSDSSPNFEKIARATVTVRSRVTVNNNQSREIIGVGVVIKRDGYIITNEHLVKNAGDIFVRVAGKEYRAKIIKADNKNDLAILKANGLNLKPLKLGKAADIRLGEKVYALGKPFLTSDNFTVTSGIISSLPINLPKGSPKLLQTDAVINPGNSGGPLINQKGELIAVTTAYLSTGDNAAGIGFAIPIDTVRNFMKSTNLK